MTTKTKNRTLDLTLGSQANECQFHSWERQDFEYGAVIGWIIIE